jgi:hypothetical protein
MMAKPNHRRILRLKFTLAIWLLAASVAIHAQNSQATDAKLSDLEAASCIDCSEKSSPIPAGLEEQLSDILNHTPQAKKRSASQARPNRQQTATSSQSMVTRLVNSARRSALKLRETSDNVRERTGKAWLAGNETKGKCFQAVKEALFRAGWTKTNPRTLQTDQAIEAHTNDFLKNENFKLRTDLLRLFKSKRPEALARMPPAVLVYSGGKGHNDGHIEILVNGVYYSDMMGARSSVATSRHHRLVAVYTKETI